MRVSSELRVTVSIEAALTEKLMLASMTAGMPLNDFISECLERALEGEARKEPPVPFASPPVAEQVAPPSAEVPVPAPLVRRERPPEPEAMVTPSFSGWMAGEAKHYEATSTTPRPEPAPFKSPVQTPTKTHYPGSMTARKDTTPTGVMEILALAEQIADIRKRALAEAPSGAPQARDYSENVARRTKEAGLEYLSKGQAQELANIARERDEILAWATPIAHKLDHLAPSGLLYRWAKHKQGIETGDRGRPKLMPNHQPLVKPPELRKAEPPKLSEPPKTETAIPALLNTHADKFPDAVYRSFNEVNQLRLNSYDQRVLRRFTDALRKLPNNAKNAASAQIASIIRDIRGGERGDTPFCAQRLAALGVLVGISGSYHLRNEYLSSDYFHTHA